MCHRGAFFPTPRPGNLITVPCCQACRLGTIEGRRLQFTGVPRARDEIEVKTEAAADGG
jgi:hypothetical protein